MKQLRDTIRPTLIVTYPGGRDQSDHQDWLRPRGDNHNSQLHDGNYFFLAWARELIHDLLMTEKVWHVRVDPERVETNSISEPGRCVYVRCETGWLTKFSMHR